MMPDMTYVDSSNIEAIGYDEDSEELYVQFLSGGCYIYHKVPSYVFGEMMNAPSKGSFLNREIKGIYSYAKQ